MLPSEQESSSFKFSSSFFKSIWFSTEYEWHELEVKLDVPLGSLTSRSLCTSTSFWSFFNTVWLWTDVKSSYWLLRSTSETLLRSTLSTTSETFWFFPFVGTELEPFISVSSVSLQQFVSVSVFSDAFKKVWCCGSVIWQTFRSLLIDSGELHFPSPLIRESNSVDASFSLIKCCFLMGIGWYVLFGLLTL